MFCQNCGNQIADTDCFCPLCGSKIHNHSQNNFTQQQFSQNDTIRNAEIDKIKSLIYHFSLKKQTYSDYDMYCSKLTILNKGKRVVLLVWGIILSSLGLLFLLAFSTSAMTYEDIKVLIVLFFFTLFPGLLMICLFIIYAVNFEKEKRLCIQKCAALSRDLYNHYLSYPSCPIRYEYCTPELLTFLLEIMLSGRATTCNEALVLATNTTGNPFLSGILKKIETNSRLSAFWRI